MINKILLSIIFINFGIQNLFATTNFESYKDFKNFELDAKNQAIIGKLSKFDTIRVKSENDYLLKESINTKNEYYYNLAQINYADYYFFKGDLNAIIKLYDENINQPKTKHLLSYILLLSKYYHIFYNYGADKECHFILSQIKHLKDNLPHKEKLYATAIYNTYNGLIEDDNNKFELKKNLLLDAIKIIEFLKDDLSAYEYKVRLSNAYNHLGICYTNNWSINSENEIDYNKSELEHAASLFRKAIRINNDSNYFFASVFKSNLSFVNNILGVAEDAIYYGTRSMFLSSKIKNKCILFRRSACNIADTYMLNNLTNTVSYKDSKKICEECNEIYKKDKAFVTQKIEKINHPVVINYDKDIISGTTWIGIVIGIALLLSSFLVYKKIKK